MKATFSSEMDAVNQKYIERAVSQRALQMGSSFSCQICVVGFLSGVCLTSLFLAALTSTSTSLFRPISFSTMSLGNSTSDDYNNDRVSLLYSAWSAALMLNKSATGRNGDEYLQQLQQQKHGGIYSNLPNAPHLENCEAKTQLFGNLDKREGNERFPPWTSWKGFLHTFPVDLRLQNQAASEGAYPPWIAGSDEENYPLTRKVQRDLWIHQHPLNCNHPNVKFLVADWERFHGYGIGAQIASMCGLLGIAINEGRVLITNYYNRADHDACEGTSRSSWDCYFFPETSSECRQRAFELMNNEEAQSRGIVTTKENYTSKHVWAGPTPRKWGLPWNNMQPTTDINGTLLASHRKMDRRWWRAQAVRYLMRFPTEYTCNLMNEARHAAFGKLAAKMVLESLGENWPKEIKDKPRSSEIEEYVWSNHKPWVPTPLLSMHVRIGDKALEMKVVEFEEYMQLAEQIRKHFPNLNNIWLSTEMQQVIDKTREYPQWNFHYTKVRRQVKNNMSMAVYEASLGRKTSTNYPLVNFLMAADSNFFVGALGSTWSFFIDGMRNTGGKVMAGYLSVNKDRFW